MAVAKLRSVFTANMSGRPERNLAKLPPRRQGMEKSDVLTLLLRVFKGYVFRRETSMGVTEGKAILRDMGKQLLFDQFTQHMTERNMAFLNTSGDV